MLENLEDRIDFYHFYILIYLCIIYFFLSELINCSVNYYDYTVFVINEWVHSIGGMNVTWDKWSTQSKTCTTVPLCPPQIPCRLAWDQTWSPMVRGQWLTAWATAQPSWLWTARKCMAKKEYHFDANKTIKRAKTKIHWCIKRVSISAHCFLHVKVIFEPNHCLCVAQYY